VALTFAKTKVLNYSFRPNFSLIQKVKWRQSLVLNSVWNQSLLLKTSLKLKLRPNFNF